MDEGWTCAARKQSLPEPADCNWPVCGCDPYADKVIAALEESGLIPPAPATSGREVVLREEQGDWPLEQRAFNAVNSPQSVDHYQALIRDLWAAYCDATHLSDLPADREGAVEREACAVLAETQTERTNRDDESEEGVLYGYGYEQACADTAAATRARPLPKATGAK